MALSALGPCCKHGGRTASTLRMTLSSSRPSPASLLVLGPCYAHNDCTVCLMQMRGQTTRTACSQPVQLPAFLQVLGPYYAHDGRNVFRALWEELGACAHVAPDAAGEKVYWYH